MTTTQAIALENDPMSPAHPKSSSSARTARPAHDAIDALVEKLRAEGEHHSFRLDSLLKENAELRSELARLQAEIETNAALPPKKAPRKPKAPKPAEASARIDPVAP